MSKNRKQSAKSTPFYQTTDKSDKGRAAILSGSHVAVIGMYKYPDDLGEFRDLRMQFINDLIPSKPVAPIFK